MSNEEENITAQSISRELCPFCFEKDISIVTDCYDDVGKKICELWDCQNCGGFFPKFVEIQGEDGEFDASEGEKTEGVDDDEKRRTPRFPVQFVVQVDFAEGTDENKKGGFFGKNKKAETLSEPIVAMVMDAGVGGLCFRYPEFVEEGKMGRMKISLPSAQRSFTATGTVVRSTKLPDGSYGLGIQFSEVEEAYRQALDRYVRVD